MAKGHEGIGRGILFTRGLAEWFEWVSGTLRGESGVQGRIWGKHELPKPYDEIVVLFANIIQEVT